MDKMRLFDASVYFGKGSMLFTSTDQNLFWDEEISFDIHQTHDVDIPQEALVLPPVEVIDALFDIYYQVPKPSPPLGPMHLECNLIASLTFPFFYLNIALLSVPSNDSKDNVAAGSGRSFRTTKYLFAQQCLYGGGNNRRLQTHLMLHCSK